MEKIVITGTNGYIGKNILTYFQEYDNYKLISLNRDNCNLTDIDSVSNFFHKHTLDGKKIDCIIHCAIKGGRRNVIDSPDIVYDNLKMFYNLYEFEDSYNKFINISSGAELDNKLKFQPYGISKRAISDICGDLVNFYNLYVWGLFSANENNDRFIKSNLLRYINKEPMIIHQNKKMDFYYMGDFLHILHYYLINNDDISKNIMAVYDEKYTLLDIANYINTLSDHTVDIIIENNDIANDYCGKSNHNFNKKAVGLFNGIKITYNNLLNEGK